MIEGTIHAYTGAKGKGKTLSMVKDMYKYSYRGWEIYTNIGVNFAHNELTEEHIKNLNRSAGLKNCVIAIDEIQIFFDSRLSQKKENKNFSNFVQQIRKRNIKLLFTTQYISTVDKRIRQHIDYIIKPKMLSILSNNDICQYRIVDMSSIEENEFGEITMPKERVTNFLTEQIFKLYDTKEMK